MQKKNFMCCLERELNVSAEFLPGAENIKADRASRIFSNDTAVIFSQIYERINIDLFATRITLKLESFIALKQEPKVYLINALLHSWT